MAEKDTKTLNIYQRIVAARSKMTPVKRNALNAFAKYEYADISAITSQLKPAFDEANLCFELTEEEPWESGYYEPAINSKGVTWHSTQHVVITNPDNPDEQREYKVSSVGTNESPEKAHGSAFTYSLKFWYKNFFLINDGEGDPDSTETTQKVQGKQDRQQPQKPKAQKADPAPKTREDDPNDTFSEENQTRTTVKPSAYGELYRLGAEAGLTNDQIKAGIKKTLGNRAESEMTLAEFNKLKRSLTKKIEALGENTDGE